jgi:5'-3' exonuclease
LLLKERVRELKTLVYKRIKTMCDVNVIVEADDLVIMYANQGYLISAMDKDIIHQTPTQCFNFKKWEWSKGLDSVEINTNRLIQSIEGDSTDNIKGVKGMGKVKAGKFVADLTSGTNTFTDYVNLFSTPEDMLMNMRLVDMHQYNGTLTMTTVQDISDMIDTITIDDSDVSF